MSDVRSHLNAVYSQRATLERMRMRTLIKERKRLSRSAMDERWMSDG